MGFNDTLEIEIRGNEDKRFLKKDIKGCNEKNAHRSSQ